MRVLRRGRVRLRPVGAAPSSQIILDAAWALRRDRRMHTLDGMPIGGTNHGLALAPTPDASCARKTLFHGGIRFFTSYAYDLYRQSWKLRSTGMQVELVWSTTMNLVNSSFCTFYGSLWPFLLESCTPGQVSTKTYKAVLPAMRHIMLFRDMVYWGMYSLVLCHDRPLAPYSYHGQYEVCKGMYKRVCTSPYSTSI
jgi:hypothetical protein